jgi:8-oxo-dGTP diphosphatase
MKVATLGYLLTPEHLGAGWKKKKIGKGKVMGFGGKGDEGESPVACMVREGAEELKTVTFDESALELVAFIEFYNTKSATEPMFACHVFLIHRWEGEPAKTDEFEFMWIPRNDLDKWLDKMPSGDRLWLPRILAGERLRGSIRYEDTTLERVVESCFEPMAEKAAV